MSTIKRQHYVPVFYLRRFAHDNRHVVVFDKPGMTSHVSNVTDIANEKYFYDFPQTIGDKAIVPPESALSDPQMMERRFAEFEAFFSDVLEHVLSRIDEGKKIGSAHRTALAQFIVLQFTRTRAYRSIVEEMWQQAPELLTRDGVYAELQLHPEKYSDEAVRVLHSGLIASLDFQETVQAVANHVWLFGTPDSKHPFYASDNPVGSGQSPAAGLTGQGIQLAFPLDPHHVLLLFERANFDFLDEFDGGCVSLNAKDVAMYNAWQVHQSHRQVYSYVNEWRLAERLCGKYPQLREPNRVRLPANWKEHVIISGTEVSDWDAVLAGGTEMFFSGTDVKVCCYLMQPGERVSRDGKGRHLHYNCVVEIIENNRPKKEFSSELDVGKAYLACMALDSYKHKVVPFGGKVDVAMNVSVWSICDARGYFEVSEPELVAVKQYKQTLGGRRTPDQARSGEASSCSGNVCMMEDHD